MQEGFSGVEELQGGSNNGIWGCQKKRSICRELMLFKIKACSVYPNAENDLVDGCELMKVVM